MHQCILYYAFPVYSVLLLYYVESSGLILKVCERPPSTTDGDASVIQLMTVAQVLRTMPAFALLALSMMALMIIRPLSPLQRASLVVHRLVSGLVDTGASPL